MRTQYSHIRSSQRKLGSRLGLNQETPNQVWGERGVGAAPARICRAFSLLAEKAADTPWKKHDNLPL